MTYYYKYLILSQLVTVSTYAAPENLLEQKKAAVVPREVKGATSDLKTSSSSYSHQYSNWGGSNPGGYEISITGVGTIDDRSDYYDPRYNKLGGYDSSIKNIGYGSSGYGGLGPEGYKGGREGYGGYGGLSPEGYGGYGGSGYGVSAYSPSGYGSSGYGTSGYGLTGYGGLGSEGYKGGREGYGGYGQNVYGGSGYSPSGYGTSGFGASGLDGTGGYFNNAGYSGGNGGYGGYGGNGGLASYSGYNNPYYQGAGHLGYGYYNKKPGYGGNIYSNGITPSLVTGYRGYTRR